MGTGNRLGTKTAWLPGCSFVKTGLAKISENFDLSFCLYCLSLSSFELDLVQTTQNEGSKKNTFMQEKLITN